MKPLPVLKLIIFLLTISTALSARSEALIVGLGELDYPPFYFTDNGILKGAAVEIAENVAQKSGYQLFYERTPWKRLQYKLKDGSIDMVILYFNTPERAQDVVYTSAPHVYENSFIVAPKSLQLNFDGSLQSVKDYEMFYVQGYSHGKEFDSASYLKKNTVINESQLLNRVSSGRPFLGVGNKPALLMYAEKAGLSDKIRFLEPPIDRGANYMAFSKKRPDANKLAILFSEQFQIFAKTEAYRTILLKYGFNYEQAN